MLNLLLAPGAPFYAISLAGALIAAGSVMQMERARRAITGVRALPRGKGLAGRVALGHIAALPFVAAIVLASRAAGAHGTVQLAALAAALAAYLYIGWIIPRKPLVRAQRERLRLRKQTPGLISYVRISLSGGESPARLLERYIARPDPRRAEMQELVREALHLVHKQRVRPFEALRLVAHTRKARELIDVAEALAQSEQTGGGTYERALSAHERTLVIILEDEFKRTLRKRTLAILLISAIALVIGVLGNILWIMTGPILRGAGEF